MTRAFDITAALAAAALVLAAALAGCTSDAPNNVGQGLVSIQVDTALAPLELSTVDAFAAVPVTDPNVPFGNRQVLYLGSQQGNASAILVNFDFSDVFSADFPETLFTRDKIQSVNFSLTMLDVYGNTRYRVVDGDSVPVPPTDIHYRVSPLDAPYDTTLAPPLAIPPHGAPIIDDLEGNRGKEPFLPVNRDSFLAWVDRGEVIGFLVQPGPGSDEGLVGYASRELTLTSQLDPLFEGTVPAPNFVVNFADEDENFLLPPVADTSTFHTVTTPPDDPVDSFLLRTGDRSYPALLFDFSGLPANAYVNRAVLRLTCDPDRGFGPLTTLWASELTTEAFGAGTLTVDALDLATYPIAEITSVDPYQVRTIEFNVTQYVQRRVNHVYSGERGLVVTAAEPFYYAGGRALKPDFYFAEFHMLGTGAAAADSLYPHLRITYTTTAGLGEDTP